VESKNDFFYATIRRHFPEGIQYTTIEKAPKVNTGDNPPYVMAAVKMVDQEIAQYLPRLSPEQKQALLGS
jgi:hypothetical protein